MCFRAAPSWILCFTALVVADADAAVPPGRQHVLTIEGKNTVTFMPRSGLNPAAIEYKAQIEYIVNNRDVQTSGLTRKAGEKSSITSVKTRRKRGGKAEANAVSAVDIALHSTEMTFRRNEHVVVESRMSRARFQGRINPDAPVLNVGANEAPPFLEHVLKSYDATAGTMLIDEDANVVSRKFRSDIPFHAIVETLLSIHTPIPRAVAFWEAPTRLVMGHGQTAKGKLRFEKEKESVARTGGLVRVKVSGVLKAEGAIVGNLIKDGTYAVTGEQMYDPSSREWKAARWSVAIDNELVSPAGLTIAHASGKMLVTSRLFSDSPSTNGEPALDKP